MLMKEKNETKQKKLSYWFVSISKGHKISMILEFKKIW
jgi:hypothetical protein